MHFTNLICISAIALFSTVVALPVIKPEADHSPFKFSKRENVDIFKRVLTPSPRTSPSPPIKPPIPPKPEGLRNQLFRPLSPPRQAFRTPSPPTPEPPRPPVPPKPEGWDDPLIQPLPPSRQASRAPSPPTPGPPRPPTPPKQDESKNSPLVEPNPLKAHYSLPTWVHNSDGY